ncbi:MAG: aldehyde dehydrogenase family protein [Acidobacteriota bacterium]
MESPRKLWRTRWSSNEPADEFIVENPATGATLAVVQGSGAAEVDAAVNAAHQAFQMDWRNRPARERGKLLLEIAQVIRAHADEIAWLETRENGKPFGQSRFVDVEACIGSFEFFGSLIEKLPGHCNDLGAILSTEFLEPYGVIGGIIPFNWPPIHFAAKTAPALAVGNTVVLKPGEQAPLAVMRLAELAGRVLPEDVLHVVPGTGKTGAALVSHPLVRKLSFTGAPETGKKVLQAAANNLTPALLELGGKNPLIVFADADVERALAAAVEGAFFNQGEACTAASRLLVHSSLHDLFVEKMSAAVRKLRVGDGLNPATHVGPLVTKQQQHRVLDYIAIGQQEGARIAAQAALPTDEVLRGGFFVAPTLFTEVTPEHRIAREEIFGPVTCVLKFDSYKEAIAIANDTEFGLVAAVFTRDQQLAMRASRDLEAGIVFVNNYNRQFMGTPFGGVKASGYGREHCVQTLQEFGYTKAVRTLSGRGEPLQWPALKELLG